MGELIGSINPDMKEKVRLGGRQMLTKLNGGGAPIRIKTTVGNISVNSR